MATRHGDTGGVGGGDDGGGGDGGGGVIHMRAYRHGDSGHKSSGGGGAAGGAGRGSGNDVGRVLGNDEKEGHLRHGDRTAGIPVADVAFEGSAAATRSITSVRIPSKEVAHVRDEGHLQDKSRAR